jgi:diguanylate cyclase (GGDEF)-like protein
VLTEFREGGSEQRSPRQGRTPRCGWLLTLGFGWVLLTAAAPTLADTPMRFVHVGVDDGLSQGTINAIVQDAQGFMWLATQDGLDRYDGNSFIHLSQHPTDRGALPRNYVTRLASDRFGTLWIGTDGGGLASRDDATGVITRRVVVGGAPVLADAERVQTLYVDREDRVWVGTADHGLVLLDRAHGTVRRFRHDPSDQFSLSDDSVQTVLEDKRGQIWVGTSRGLSLLDPLTGKIREYPLPVSRDLSAGTDDTVVHALLEDVLWVGTGKGLVRLDPRAAEPITYRHDATDDSSLPSGDVYALLEDDSHRVWVGTADGLALWDRATDRFRNYRHSAGDQASLPGNDIRTLYQDRGGVIWIGTDSDGAARWNPRSWSFGHRQIASLRGHGVENIVAFTEGNDDTLWVATLDEGLRAIDGNNRVSKIYRHRPGDPHSLPSDRINSICTGLDGTLWVASRSSLSRLDSRTGRFEQFPVKADGYSHVVPSDVDEVVADSKGFIWLAMNGGGLARFDVASKAFKIYRHDAANPESLPDDHVHAVAEDRTGKLWVGTDTGGLALFDPSTEHFYRYAPERDNANNLNGPPVYAIHVDDQGTVWVGTLGGGLVEIVGNALAPATIRFRIFSEPEGLANSTVYAVESDSAGQIWVSTNRGLARLDPASGRFRSFHHSHGLQGEEFNEGAGYRRRDGQLLFGGPNGYNAFDPQKLEFNPHEPPIALTGYYKLNAPVATTVPVERLAHAELGYRDYVVSFEFAALDYSSPESNQFSYMLQGFDKTWVDAGNRRVATYTNLPGGRYVFKVRAANADGKWNSNGIALPISVESPPWATAPAKVCYAVTLFLLILAMLHFQRAKLRREVEYSNRLKIDVDTRTSELTHANRQLKEASLTDQLTGLGNRRQMSEAMAALQQSTKESGKRRLVLLVVDLDYLKPINDTYGHEAGDRVINQIADLLRRCCRSSDYLVRWGGDEFVIAFLDADLDDGAALAEKIRSQVSKQIFRFADGKAARCTCTVGFCAYPFLASEPDMLTWEQTLAIADAGLNQAKAQRNYWVGIESTDLSRTFDARLIGALNIDPIEIERQGYIMFRLPPFRPDDTGIHQRVVGRRNRD